MLCFHLMEPNSMMKQVVGLSCHGHSVFSPIISIYNHLLWLHWLFLPLLIMANKLLCVCRQLQKRFESQRTLVAQFHVWLTTVRSVWEQKEAYDQKTRSWLKIGHHSRNCLYLVLPATTNHAATHSSGKVKWSGCIRLVRIFYQSNSW